ncbi:MAG: cupin domain-containing protein [Rhodothermales bacterium]
MLKHAAVVFALLTTWLAVSPRHSPAQQQGITLDVLHESPLSVSDSLMSVTIRATFAPGGTTGWHLHPGDERAVVLEGQLEIHGADGTVRRVAAGEAYENRRNVIHETVNPGDTPTVIIATFILPLGARITEPVIRR